MKKSLKRVLSVILAAAMLLALVLPSFAAVNGKAATNKVRLNFEKVENGPDALHAGEAVKSGLTQALPVGDVRVSIVLDGASTLEKGFSTQAIASNRQAMSYRSQLLQQQNALAEKISKEVLGGKKLEVKWNLTLAANIISAVVPSIAIDRISAMNGVKKVVIERQYEPAVASVEAADPNMATSTKMTGAMQSWANGYTGLGSKVAIIDTGIDTDHQSFDAAAFEYAVEESGKDVALLTQDDVADLYDYLNISYYVDAGAAAYESSKIPFAVNYVDGDLDVTHDNDTEGEHGSHVAGIAAANRYIATDNGFESAILLDSVLTQGAAPDAQILVMKVFGKGGGAYDSDYMAAIEDAVILGADAINLSLGSANPGFATDDTYQEILDSFRNYDAVVSISAGNAGAWADASTYGVLWGEDKSFDTVGSPGSFSNALTVASVDNDGATGPYFVAHGFMDYPMFYTETSGDGKNELFTTLAGDREFIYIDNNGTAEDFEAVADVLEGKIAICNRGDITFVEKCTNAAANGAIGVIIANNQSGTISMALDGYNYSAPAVSITQENAYYLRNYFSDAVTDDNGAVLYYTGTITVGDGAMVNDTHPDFHTMSDFSSFGVPGDLSLKPEITAPGGNIYSVNGLVPGGQAYENMSGTSMAAPHITGLTALVAQYIRENGLEEKTGLTVRQLAQSLLMSTAEPMFDADGYYYSVFQQGAGLANADSAINAKSYILMGDMWDYATDGKVKAELGDDPDRTGEYDIAFSLNNITDEDVQYDLAADFFTQYLWNYSGLPVNDKSTDYVGADVEWTVNGEAFDMAAGLDYDFNGDGASTVEDIRFLLDYIAGNEPAIANEEYADYDQDGDIDTFDAYQILKELNSVSIIAPANGSVDIVAHVTLDPDDIGYYDVNGNYVEGYIYAAEVSTADGAYGVTHSIPVLGFYGSWTEASMTDMGSVLEYDFDLMDRYPYVMEDENNPSVQGFLVKSAGDTDSYYLSGNPAVYDDYYIPERNSFNSNDMLSSVVTTLIRNAAASRFYVTNGNDEVVYEQIDGAVESAFYYVNQGAWYYTSNEVKTKYTPADLQEGDTVTFNLSYAPEYYVNEDGTVDWDALGEGATMSYSAVIDNTAPELTDVVIDGYDPETGLWDNITFSAQDNRYIAAIAVFNDWGELLDVIPADLDAVEGAITDVSYTYDYLNDNSWFGTDRILIQVYDYASNVTNYKLNFDLEDLSSDVEIYLPEEAAVILNATIQLEAEVYPWGVDESVVWSSSDESIATVDQNGVVTGNAEGVCVITATSAFAPTAKADCIVTVTRIEKTLNGVVWDETGKQWFSEIDVAKLPEYTKLTEDYIGATVTSVAYGPYGELFASDADGEIYIVDPDTLELIDLGNLGIELSDLAPSASLGDDVIMAAYGSYILMIDLYTGEISGFDYSDDLGGATIVGVAAFESTMNTYYNVPIDVYFFIDSEGYIYEDAYIVIENDPELDDGTYNFGADIVSYLGASTDSYHFNSLYFDGQSIYWARFNNNTADIICEYDIFDLDIVANLGSFAEDVWPAAALFEFGVNPIEFDFEVDDTDAFKSPDFTGAKAKTAAAPIAKAASVTMPVKGALNTANNDPADPPIVITPVANMFYQTVELTVDQTATNGLITVEYDASRFALDSVRSAASFYTYNDDADNGIVTFAYVNRDDAAFAEGDTAATLIFASTDTADGTYKVTTKEINDEHPTDASDDVTVTPEHEMDDPAWVWTPTGSGYEAKYVIKCLAHDNCEENIEIAATVECFESAEATCTEGVGKRWVATVEYNGEILTDELTDYSVDPLGHEMVEVTAEDPTCTDPGNIACYQCTRCELYFADENGEELLETDDVVIPATGHDIVLVDAYIPCIKDGIAEHYECLNCGKLFSDEEGKTEVSVEDLVITGTGHEWDEGQLIKEPTCTAGGVLMYTCLNNPNHKRTEYVPPYGHGEMELIEGSAPTCTEEGYYDCYICSVCQEIYWDEEGAYAVEDLYDLVIPATGHEMEFVDAAEATCTEDGNVAYYLCANCGGTFADENGDDEIEDVVIPATGHTMEKTDAKEPTCEEDGNVEYYTCSVCGDTFADAEGVTALTDEEIVIDALGHAWDEGTVISPATCTEKGVMMYVCDRDPSHVSYLALSALGHTLEKVDAVEATCTEDGNVDYYACTVCGDTFADSEGVTLLEDVAVPALGHDLVKTEAKPATCTEDGNVKYYTCTRCGKTFEDSKAKRQITDTVVPAAHTLVKVDAKDPTVDADGNIKYYLCTVCGEMFADAAGTTPLQPEDVVIPALENYKLGDINRDGNITAEDARLALRASVGLETYELGSIERLAGDVNLDGNITADDARSILRASVGLEDPDSWGKTEQPSEPPTTNPEESTTEPSSEPVSEPSSEPSSDTEESTTKHKPGGGDKPSEKPSEKPSSKPDKP